MRLKLIPNNGCDIGATADSVIFVYCDTSRRNSHLSRVKLETWRGERESYQDTGCDTAAKVWRKTLGITTYGKVSSIDVVNISNKWVRDVSLFINIYIGAAAYRSSET